MVAQFALLLPAALALRAALPPRAVRSPPRMCADAPGEQPSIEEVVESLETAVRAKERQAEIEPWKYQEEATSLREELAVRRTEMWRAGSSKLLTPEGKPAIRYSAVGRMREKEQQRPADLGSLPGANRLVALGGRGLLALLAVGAAVALSSQLL